jgi:hypothetical protein
LGDHIKKNEIDGVCSTYQGRRDFYRVLVGKTKGKRPLGKHVHGLEGSMKIDLKELGWEGMDCIYLAQDRDQWQALINMLMKLLVS